MLKRLVIAIVLIAVVCGGIVGFNLFRDNAIKEFFANMPRPAVTVSTVKAAPVTWKPEIEALGTINAAKGVDLTVETTGVVREIAFKANDRVETGALLIRLDNAVQIADLEATKAQAALDEQNRERALELQRRQVGAQSNVQQAEAAAAASSAQVAKLQAVLEQKELRAPFSGTIGIPRVDIGQYLAPGNVVATLQDLETMRVDFTVPEQQLPELKIGQAVRLGLTSQELAFAGRITGIDPKVDPSTRLVAVRAEVANPEGRLTPGQFVQVRVELPVEDNVMALPQTVLTSSLYGDFVYVVVPDEKAADKRVARQVFVKAGRRSEGRVEIVEGVKPGDEVVTAGQNRLSNGTPVAVDNTVDPSRPAQTEAAR